MPTVADTIGVLASVLEGDGGTLSPVSGIGVVNRYDRFFADQQSFLKFHGRESGGRYDVSSATITVSGFDPEDTARDRQGHGRADSVAHVYDIKLIRAQDDAGASQTAVAELTRAVIEAFDSDAARAALLVLGFVYDTPGTTAMGMAQYAGGVLVNQAIVQIVLRECL